MVSTVNNTNTALTTLLRTQATGAASVKNSPKAQTAIITQLSRADKAGNARSITLTNAQPSAALPRGSLVDKLV